jgi:hypothetical protein
MNQNLSLLGIQGVRVGSVFARGFAPITAIGVKPLESGKESLYRRSRGGGWFGNLAKKVGKGKGALRSSNAPAKRIRRDTAPIDPPL